MVAYGIIGGVTLGVVVLVGSAAVYAGGLLGLRTGRSVGSWSALLGLAAAGVACGALLVQADPDAASWILAPAAGAVLGVVHARALFAQGGPFRT